MINPKKDKLKIAIIVLFVFVLAFFHYLTGVQRTPYYGFYCRLYYLPIVLAGLWFCLRGGVATALLVSVIFAPHVFFKWGQVEIIPLEHYLEIVLFNLTGFLTGFLSSRINFQSLRAEKNMEQLSESFTKLREQANLIVEIEDQLRQADRLTALGELSAGMAHEIRNPLGSIRGTAEILRDALPDDNQYSEFSQILIKEVDRLNRVVEDFLNFARPTADDQHDFKPNEILHEVLQLCRQQITKDNIQIHWQENPLPAAVGDAAQFKQVFLNLILNAFQAMPSGGELWIESEVNEKNQVVLTFRDSGSGIPVDDLDRIFNPFFTTKAKGTGLGLAITYRILKNHCGEISVLNSPMGGAEFTMILKAADSSSKQRADGE
ncbi:MAG: ATP-binding protein [Thermodesulfobacteriota bacterium]|nr:ATP-binding protein [Thermodesulfobacteriota bacterium]